MLWKLTSSAELWEYCPSSVKTARLHKICTPENLVKFPYFAPLDARVLYLKMMSFPLMIPKMKRVYGDLYMVIVEQRR